MRKIAIFADEAALANAAAEHFVLCSADAIAARGRFIVALSGGNTPRGMHAQLSAPSFSHRVDWPCVQVFWVDERCVPSDDPQSNYRMARETLLDRVPLPAANIHRVLAEKEPHQAAEEYERELRAFFSLAAAGHKFPHFDLILLGMGEDGHTASLFPDTPALRERTRWVVANYVEKLNAWRISLTLPVINAAKQVIFLVSGKEKARCLREVFFRRAALQPAQMVRPESGELLWLLDKAAARDIQPSSP